MISRPVVGAMDNSVSNSSIYSDCAFGGLYTVQTTNGLALGKVNSVHIASISENSKSKLRLQLTFYNIILDYHRIYSENQIYPFSED